MVYVMPDDLARPPAEALARLMLECAREDPTLVQRSRGRGRNPQTRGGELPAAGREPDSAIKQHLEDLVSIAVSSAQEADYVLQRAHAASKKAKRGMWAFAGVGALGMAAGIAGIVDNHLNTAVNQKLTETRNSAVPAPDVSAIVRGDLSPPRSIESGQLAAIAPSPTKQAPPAAQGAAGLASKLKRSASLEVAPSLPPDRSMARTGAAGTGQNAATIALGTAQLSELDAKEANRRLAEVRGQVAQIEKPMVAPHHAAPTAAHPALRPVPYRELPAVPLQTTARVVPSAAEHLILARKALLDNNSREARELLEAAQTSIVFAPKNAASGHATIATAQIAETLRMLNLGDAVHALLCLDRAIAAMQPTF